MKTKKQQEIATQLEDLYQHLEIAYDMAGGLRDSFTGIGKDETQLKEFCNNIRGKIYELRTEKGNFKTFVNFIP